MDMCYFVAVSIQNFPICEESFIGDRYSPVSLVLKGTRHSLSSAPGLLGIYDLDVANQMLPLWTLNIEGGSQKQK